MPHFNSSGEETYVCQKCGGVFAASQRRPSWRPDVSGHKSAGTCCSVCVTDFDQDKDPSYIKEQKQTKTMSDWADEYEE